MRKKKENVLINSDPDIPKTPGLETQREERYEETSGESSTVGLGAAYTNEPRFEKTIQTGDGPLAGETTDPPLSKREITGSRRKSRRRHRGRTVGRHAAARSSKTI